MFTFYVFISCVYATDSRSIPYTTLSPSILGTCTFLEFSSSYSFLATLYHSNNLWKVILSCCAMYSGTTSIVPSYEHILFSISCSTASIDWDSYSNVNVILNLYTNSSHLLFIYAFSIPSTRSLKLCQVCV
jgi:hypothetical protein